MHVPSVSSGSQGWRLAHQLDGACFCVLHAPMGLLVRSVLPHTGSVASLKGAATCDVPRKGCCRNDSRVAEGTRMCDSKGVCCGVFGVVHTMFLTVWSVFWHCC